MPLSEGHLLLVPRAEVDRWPDLPASWQRSCSLWHKISGALDQALDKDRVALTIRASTFRTPTSTCSRLTAWLDYDPANAKKDATAEELGCAAEKVRAALREVHGLCRMKRTKNGSLRLCEKSR